MRAYPTISSVLLLLAALCPVPVAAGQTAYVSVNAGGNNLEVRPTRIHLVSNENLEAVQWVSWGGATARATAVDVANAPSAGLQGRNPVEVEARRLQRCDGRRVYTTLRLHFTAGVPYDGQPTTTTYRYGCPPPRTHRCAAVRTPVATASSVEATRTLSCRSARRVIGAYFTKVGESAQRDGGCAQIRSTKGCRVGRFTCRTRYVRSTNSLSGRCDLGSRFVRFSERDVGPR